MATSRLEIDLGAVERNLALVRSVLTPEAPAPRAGARGAAAPAVCAVLKQDGYGLGAARLAKRLVSGGPARAGVRGSAGAEMIAVYTLDEARVVADAVAGAPILVLMPVPGIDRMDPIYRHLTSGRIHLTLHSLDQLRLLAEMSTRIGATLPVHVQVDTGLSRGGAMPESAHALVQKLLATPRMQLAGLMTHFSSPCCDADFTREQARLFRDFVEGVKPVLKAAVTAAAGQGVPAGVVAPQDLMLHAANSCAMFRARSYHGTMVRLGQALLGYALEDVPKDEAFEFADAAGRLEPAVRWTSTVVHVAEIPAGWPVGYGSAWRAPWRPGDAKTKIALIPVGYADGYPRSLGGKPSGGPGQVAFTGQTWDRRAGGVEIEDLARTARSAAPRPAMPPVYAPVIGRVSMDQIVVDVTHVPEAYLQNAGSLEGGPEVELVGRDRTAPNFISTLAASAGSITHELLTRIGPRVERAYRSSGAPLVAGSGSTSTAHAAPTLRIDAAHPRPVTAAGREDLGGTSGVAAYAP